MWSIFFILSTLFNLSFASPPGSRDIASSESHQKNWDYRHDKKTQPSASSSHLREYYYGSEPQSVPLDLSTKNRQIIQYAPPSSSGAKNKFFDCFQCGKSYTKSSNLDRHVNTEHKGRTFDCSKCGRKFTTKKCLENHDNAEHQENSKTYKCDQCTYETKHRSSFSSHNRRHKH